MNPLGYSALPTPRCFVPAIDQPFPTDYATCLRLLCSIGRAPADRPDLAAASTPTPSDADAHIAYATQQLPLLKRRPEVQALIVDHDLSDDEIKAIFTQKVYDASIFRINSWLNAWLTSPERSNPEVVRHVGPFFTLFYRGMEKIPKMQHPANRAIQVGQIPQRKYFFDNHQSILKENRIWNFWEVASFSFDDKIMNDERYSGKADDEAIIFMCGSTEGVETDCFDAESVEDGSRKMRESELVPLCPAIFRVESCFRAGAKLIMMIRQLKHYDMSYVEPHCTESEKGTMMYAASYGATNSSSMGMFAPTSNNNNNNNFQFSTRSASTLFSATSSSTVGNIEPEMSWLQQLAEKYNEKVTAATSALLMGQEVFSATTLLGLTKEDLNQMKIPVGAQRVLLKIIANELSLHNNDSGDKKFTPSGSMNEHQNENSNNNNLSDSGMGRKSTESYDMANALGTTSSNNNNNNSNLPLSAASSSSLDAVPLTRCFTPEKGVVVDLLSLRYETALTTLLSLRTLPSGRPDLISWVPTDLDVKDIITRVNADLPQYKKRRPIKTFIDKYGLTDDDIKVLATHQLSQLVARWLNGWLSSLDSNSLGGKKIEAHVAPYFTLLYRAMEKLPKVVGPATRGVVVGKVPALLGTFTNFRRICAPGSRLHFWALPSFCSGEEVSDNHFAGSETEEAILYSCSNLEGCEMSIFAPINQDLNLEGDNFKIEESEILPMCPTIFVSQNAVKMNKKKLIITVRQMLDAHEAYSYVNPLVLRFGTPTMSEDGVFVSKEDNNNKSAGSSHSGTENSGDNGNQALSISCQHLLNRLRSEIDNRYVFLPNQVQISDKKIGEGGYGEVYEAKLSVTGSSVSWIVAAKFCSKIEVAITEAKNYIGLHHCSVTSLMGVTTNTTNPPQVVLLLEKAEADFRSVLKDKAPLLTFDKIKRYALEIATGLAYLHSEKPSEGKRRVFHLDLKPGNVLIFSNGTLKLADFGSIKETDHLETATQFVGGTKNYLPPCYFLAMLRASMKVPVSPAYDVFAFGVMLLEMLMKSVQKDPQVRPYHSMIHSMQIAQMLFDEENKTQVEEDSSISSSSKIPRCCIAKREDISCSFPSDVPADQAEALIELCRSCLNVNAAERPADGSDLLVKLSIAFGMLSQTVVDDEEDEQQAAQSLLSSASERFNNNNSQQEQEDGKFSGQQYDLSYAATF